MVAVNGGTSRYIGIRWSEAVLQRLRLLVRIQQKIAKGQSRGLLGGCDPIGLWNDERMVAVKCSFNWINRYDRVRQVRVFLPFVGLDHQALIHHCRTQVVWPLGKHLVGEKAGAVAIVDNRTL